MAFVKAVWRILMAIKDGLVLLFMLLFFGALYAALSLSPKPPAMIGSGALVLKLDGAIVEQPHQESPFDLIASNRAPTREYRLRDVVHAIEVAGKDNKVKAIVLDLDNFVGGGQVALSRVGEALDSARAAKKPVLAFATAYTDDGYQLAAHASEIWINPIGGVMISGPGGSRLYYKGLIDKLGVNTHVYRVGTYKSFVEPFIRKDQSDEARRAMQAVYDTIWQNWRDEVGKARPGAKLAAYVNDPLAAAKAAKGNLAQAALNVGLADKLGDRTAFGARVAELAGAGDDSLPGSYKQIKYDAYVSAYPIKDNGKIGVVTVAGDIVDGEADPGTAGGKTIADLIHDALAKKDLKAIVLRVDSPGGSVLASEQIRSALTDAKARGIPVVASMGNVAASGGYWVSTAADRIIAEPSTITGSIGVFGILPSFENTLAKIGITTDGIKTTPLSGEPDVAGGFSPQFDALAQAGVEDIYRRFVGLVAGARKMTPQHVDTIAQGRVWDGGTARQLGLVDGFGSLEDAIAQAAKLAKLDPATARPVFIEQKPDYFSTLLEQYFSNNDDQSAAIPQDWLGKQAWLRQQLALQAVSDVRNLLTGSAIRADCLECRGALPQVTNDIQSRRLIDYLWSIF
ncbi:signal peptide peptidase SppA [Rhizorhapis sp. SPR117]|uniref:signal peptide peptidase SppA n=1 Tax=Rhizorhapis sp. SPR117 TaxID=2912611 RepID=UPI001EFFA550|nr:signal peptide peptidase SppA [Rhizorhapis sp. SPR117]